jgi:hypothetical protein
MINPNVLLDGTKEIKANFEKPVIKAYVGFEIIEKEKRFLSAFSHQNKGRWITSLDLSNDTLLTKQEAIIQMNRWNKDSTAIHRLIEVQNQN